MSRRKKFWVILIVSMFFVIVLYQFLGRTYSEKNKQIRTRIREKVEQSYPELAEEMRVMYGIKPAEGQVSPGSGSVGIDDVVLIHGLDDPGKVWMNLSPALTDSGYRVWIMSYPDDQPISESAQFFFEEMAALKGKKMEALSNVTIIAHSMGGLVAREMLSCPEMAYDSAAREGCVPAVSNLIMIGTPNHGSELARFRIFGEFRDQLASMLEGNYIWLHGILDGAGEAGVDLVPGSPFLEELNGRPHPENLNMVVITGVMTAWTKSDIEQFVEMMNERLPGSTHESVKGIGDLLNSMGDGLGDGVVSVNSAKLDGFPLHVLPGNHLSIIRNVMESSERVPPAIPVVLKYLENGSGAVGVNADQNRFEKMPFFKRDETALELSMSPVVQEPWPSQKRW